MTERILRDVVGWIRVHGPIPVRRAGIADQLYYVECRGPTQLVVCQLHGKGTCHEAFVQAAGGLPDIAGGPGELSPSDLAAVAAWVYARQADGTAAGLISTDYGKLFWVDREGAMHRENGPATVYCDGTQLWQRHGELHREDGPAAIWPDTGQAWYREGELHREDGPAVEFLSGYREWHRNGKRHREDGPAVIEPDGTRKWYRNDKLHREDGPAIEYADGTCEWWYNGERVDPLEVLVRAGETAGKEGAA